MPSSSSASCIDRLDGKYVSLPSWSSIVDVWLISVLVDWLSLDSILVAFSSVLGEVSVELAGFTFSTMGGSYCVPASTMYTKSSVLVAVMDDRKCIFGVINIPNCLSRLTVL